MRVKGRLGFMGLKKEKPELISYGLPWGWLLE